MQLIRCTGKLQKEMGLKKTDLSQAEDQVGILVGCAVNSVTLF